MSESQLKTADSGDAEAQANFCVVVFSRGNDPVRMAEALRDALHLNLLDARIHTAHIPGILPERLDEVQAAAVVETVRKLGVSATVTAEVDIPQLDHPETVHHAACTADGFEVFGVSGARSSFVPWTDLEFVSVGFVPMEAPHHTTTESPVVVHSAPHMVIEKSDGVAVSGPVCWLIARNPERVYFIDHRQMNYDYLESRKTLSATANFSEFLNDLVKFAADAFLTPSTHAILNHGSANDYTYPDAEQFKQKTLLQYLLHRVIEAEHLPEHAFDTTENQETQP